MKTLLEKGAQTFLSQGFVANQLTLSPAEVYSTVSIQLKLIGTKHTICMCPVEPSFDGPHEF
jgi:hypothetical protein